MYKMLATTKWKQLQELVGAVTREELIWINGYLSGLVNGEPAMETATAATLPAIPGKLTIIYGTETGNSKKLALQFAAQAKQKGIVVKVQDASQYNIAALEKETTVAIIVSTHGEGEPPAAVKKIYDALHQRNAPLPQLRFSVLALGDSAYPLFCKTGEDVDAQLVKLGATRIIPLEKCDVDFETPAGLWMNRLLQQLQPSAVTAAPVTVAQAPAATGGKKYHNGTIAALVNLNDRGSPKTTYHIEIATKEPVAYEPGDALAVIPKNRPVMVQRIIELTGVDATKEIATAKFTATVEALLTKHLNICYLLASTIKKYAAITKQEIPDTRMDLVDLLRIYPVNDAGQFEEVIQVLTPIAPRLYTIASSPLVHENEIHITVGRKEFYAQNEQKFGLCSEFLGDLPVGSAVEFYIHKNKNFRLPDADTDVVMIGPGTGVAPFRSFLAHRDAQGHSGRNWFFFADEDFTSDFLYQTEWQQYVQTGALTKLDLAFQKSFTGFASVTDLLKQQGEQLVRWLQNGAYLYVSGDKEPMSREVEAALLEVLAQHAGTDEAGAKKWLEELKKEGRYEKDVY
jgi:sulfite reductase (NADPH) flavoprotein alpha-component